MSPLRIAFVAALLAGSASAAMAADPEYQLTLKDHRFTPDTIEVPANTKVILQVTNNDSTPEEFDSHDLKREKVVGGGKSISIHIGPLDPGTYSFMGEYHEDTAKGTVVAK